MEPEIRRASLTMIETSLAPHVPAGERRQTLADLSYDQRPGQDTIAAVIGLLADADDNLRTIAETLLTAWGTQAVSALLTALRSAEPLEVPYRLAIIRQLARMETDAARAETLLRSPKDDPNVGPEAQAAIKAIRRDLDDIVGRFGQWGVELLLLSVVVVAPIIAIRRSNPNQAWPPLGIVIGFVALAVAGLMLARYQFSGDVGPDKEGGPTARSTRWKLYGQLAVAGAVLGFALGLAMVACSGPIDKLFGR